MNEHLDATGSNYSNEEQEYEKALRPKMFEDFTGQEQIIENFSIQ